MQPVSNLSVIANRYDGFLLDLWGVIHDGTHLYPGVKDTLASLRDANKKIIMISNAPRRAARAVDVLEHLGVHKDWYDYLITSGEMGYRWLESGKAGWGKRYYYIGPKKDMDILNGLDYRRVYDLKEADFLLNVGFGSEEQTMEDWDDVLRRAAQLKLPMLCLNPDLEVVKIGGARFPCAGVLARDYERLGGKVTYYGKPYPDVYEHCMRWLSPMDKSRILAVGDGIVTDIRGASRFGVDSALVTGGILKDHDESLETLCGHHEATPQYVMPAFAW